MGISMVTKEIEKIERKRSKKETKIRGKGVRVILTHSMQHSESEGKRGKRKVERESDGFGSLLDFLEGE